MLSRSIDFLPNLVFHESFDVVCAEPLVPSQIPTTHPPLTTHHPGRTRIDVEWFIELNW